MKRQWSEVRELVYRAAKDHSTARDHEVEYVALSDSLGRILARDLLAPMPLPHFDSSAMDGFAVAGPAPWRLVEEPVEEANGRNLHRRADPIGCGQARPVLTGSLLPPGAEGIVRTEHAVRRGDMIECHGDHPYRPGRDIRRAGEELARGTQLLTAGTLLGPRQVDFAAASGIEVLPVRPRIEVALGMTGNEIISSGIPAPGEVRDAFSPGFPALLEGWGAKVSRCERLPDHRETIGAWMRRAPGDLVLLTGGSGHSAQDIVRVEALELCVSVLATSVDVRPGHPTIVGLLPGGRLVIGLPGNPLAAHAMAYSLVPVFLAGRAGRPLPQLWSAEITREVPASPRTVTRLLPATMSPVDGRIRLTPLSGSSSHMLSGLARADALAVLDSPGAQPGDIVTFIPLDRH